MRNVGKDLARNIFDDVNKEVASMDDAVRNHDSQAYNNQRDRVLNLVHTEQQTKQNTLQQDYAPLVEHVVQQNQQIHTLGQRVQQLQNQPKPKRLPWVLTAITAGALGIAGLVWGINQQTPTPDNTAQENMAQDIAEIKDYLTKKPQSQPGGQTPTAPTSTTLYEDKWHRYSVIKETNNNEESFYFVFPHEQLGRTEDHRVAVRADAYDQAVAFLNAYDRTVADHGGISRAAQGGLPYGCRPNAREELRALESLTRLEDDGERISQTDATRGLEVLAQNDGIITITPDIREQLAHYR